MADQTAVTPEEGSPSPEPSLIPATNPEHNQQPAGGEQFPEWMQNLPDDLRQSKVLAKYQSPNEALKSRIEAESVFGKWRNGRLVEVPGEKADPESRKAFFEKIPGQPESPEGYQFKQPENAPDGLTLSERAVEKARHVAKKWGLPVDAFQELGQAMFEGMAEDYQELLQEVQSGNEEIQQARNEAVTALKQEWGAEYEDRLGRVQQAVKKIFGQDEGGQAVLDALRNEGIANHVGLIAFVDKMVQAFGPERFEQVAGGFTPQPADPDSVQKELSELLDSKEYKEASPEIQAQKRAPIVERLAKARLAARHAEEEKRRRQYNM